jgi:CspA family cold shock protein
MPRGKILIFNDISGKGIIEPDDSSIRINISYRNIKGKGYKILHEGQRIRYEIIKTPKGLCAINVTPF